MLPFDQLVNQLANASPCEALAFWRSLAKYAKEKAEAVQPLALLEHLATGEEAIGTIYGTVSRADRTTYQYSNKVLKLQAMLDAEKALERAEGIALEVRVSGLRVVDVGSGQPDV